MNFRAVIVALALGVASANRDFRPTAKVQIGHNKIGSGLSPDGINGEVTLESEVSDELKVGVECNPAEAGSGNPIQSVFAKLSNKMAGGDVDADMSMNVGDNQVSATSRTAVTTTPSSRRSTRAPRTLLRKWSSRAVTSRPRTTPTRTTWTLRPKRTFRKTPACL